MNECIEITKLFVAETMGAGIGIGVVLTLLTGIIVKTVIEWVIHKKHN